MTLAVLICPSATAHAQRQLRDTVSFDSARLSINCTPLGQIDSAHYQALHDNLDFPNEKFGWNLRGYIATWKIENGKFYLDKLKSGKHDGNASEHLQEFTDSEGRVLASWYTGIVIGGTGKTLYRSADGKNDLFEDETLFIINSGEVILSREYSNTIHHGKSHTADLNRAVRAFARDKFPELAEMTLVINARPTRFGDDGAAKEWDAAIIDSPEEIPATTRSKLVNEFKAMLGKLDPDTYRVDGKWCLTPHAEEDCIRFRISFTR